MAMSMVGGERRREPRLPLRLSAQLQVGTDYLRTNVVDLSTSGVGLSSEKAWPQGTPVRVALALPYTDGPKFCTLSGTVVRSQAGHVGMRLDQSVSRTDREVLSGFLALLSMRRQLAS